MLKILYKALGVGFLYLLICSLEIEASHHDPEFLHDLRILLENISSKNTGYIKGESRVVWGNHESSLCFTDSRGLLNAVFSRTYGLTPVEYHAWLGTNHPTAKNYYQAILEENRFHLIKRVTEVRPGDLLAILYLDSKEHKGEEVGHLAIVDKQPNYVEQKEPFIPGTQQWTVAVIDCAIEGHGIKDTRYQKDEKFYSGLGRGTLRLYIDVEGYVMGYAWSRLETSEFHSASVHPLIFGRLDFNR